MNNYETVFIVTPVLSDAQVKEVADKFQGIITENGEHGEHCACGHDHHGHHHADEIFDNIGVETPKRFEEAAIREALAELDDGNGAEYGQILRAKGILPLNDGKWLHFDYVPGETDFRYGPADYTGRLCVIGVKINEDAIKQLFGI